MSEKDTQFELIDGLYGILYCQLNSQVQDLKLIDPDNRVANTIVAPLNLKLDFQLGSKIRTGVYYAYG